MELNIWLKSTIERNPTWDEKSKSWTVTVDRDGQKRQMKVKHLVLSTGFSGKTQRFRPCWSDKLTTVR